MYTRFAGRGAAPRDGRALAWRAPRDGRAARVRSPAAHLLPGDWVAQRAAAGRGAASRAAGAARRPGGAIDAAARADAVLGLGTARRLDAAFPQAARRVDADGRAGDGGDRAGRRLRTDSAVV